MYIYIYWNTIRGYYSCRRPCPTNEEAAAFIMGFLAQERMLKKKMLSVCFDVSLLDWCIWGWKMARYYDQGKKWLHGTTGSSWPCHQIFQSWILTIISTKTCNSWHCHRVFKAWDLALGSAYPSSKPTLWLQFPPKPGAVDVAIKFFKPEFWP